MMHLQHQPIPGVDYRSPNQLFPYHGDILGWRDFDDELNRYLVHQATADCSGDGGRQRVGVAIINSRGRDRQLFTGCMLA